VTVGRGSDSLRRARDARKDEYRTQTGLGPGLMSVSMRSPIMIVDFECASRMFEALANHDGIRLTHEVRRDTGRALDHRRECATTRQRTERDCRSVGIGRHEVRPLFMRRTAVVISSKE